MKKILWVGSPFFSNMLGDMGWEDVYVHTPESFTLFTYENLVDVAGFTPDVLVVADRSFPPFVVGMEKAQCLTVLYVVDSHLHSWFPLYAQAFDLCLVSLFDHIPFFKTEILPSDRILWSPPYAQDAFRPKGSSELLWDCLFVGTVSENTPLRKIFLEKLSAYFPGLHVERGDFVSLFPKARVVLNFCEHGDLNFRVFEAMGLASALVSPRIGNRQDALFTNGRDYLLYDPTNPSDPVDALRAIDRLLSDDRLRLSVQENALSRIDEKHRASHRARTFTEKVAELWERKQSVVAHRLAISEYIRERFLKLLYLLWAKECQDDGIKGRYLAYAKGLGGRHG
ncbi:MAG: glycosyltransferase family 1 protein [Desulfovibrionaceae bacterium]|nr:glycosyltransferase family 1 protein [Desulfovibrionaceae bacterium]